MEKESFEENCLRQRQTDGQTDIVIPRAPNKDTYLIFKHLKVCERMKDDCQCSNVKWHDSARAECPCFSGD